MNSIVSANAAWFMPVEAPTARCWTVPDLCTASGARPISWLKSFRSSRASSALSTPIGQAAAQRRHKLHRQANSASR
jgi:hypothetical protein